MEVVGDNENCKTAKIFQKNVKPPTNAAKSVIVSFYALPISHRFYVKGVDLIIAFVTQKIENWFQCLQHAGKSKNWRKFHQNLFALHNSS